MDHKTKNDMRQQESRRKFLKSSAAVGVGAALSGFAPAILAQSKAPLKLGVINSFSKVFAATGQANLQGMNLYFEQIGGQIAGRKIQIIREDDEVNPQVGLQKIKKLVEGDECDLISGIQASNIATAAVPYLRQSKAFMLISGAGLLDLSYIKLPYVFRSSASTYAGHEALAKWLYDSGTKEILITASDYSGARTPVQEFSHSFVKLGGKLIKEIYPPLGNNDFSAYLADIKRTDPPAVFAFYAGTDAVRFVKQYDEYGLKGVTKLLSGGYMVESDTLPAQGASALGIVNSLHYADTLDNAANKKFVSDYLAKYKEYPNVYSEYGYVAAQVLHHAIEACDGNTQDKDKLRDAMLAVRLNAPRGPFEFNPNTHSPTQNAYVREVAEVDGRLTNRVLKTIEHVSEPAEKPKLS